MTLRVSGNEMTHTKVTATRTAAHAGKAAPHACRTGGANHDWWSVPSATMAAAAKETAPAGRTTDGETL